MNHPFIINTEDGVSLDIPKSSASTRMFWLSVDHLKRRFFKRAMRRFLVLILLITLMALFTTVLRDNQLKELEEEAWEGGPAARDNNPSAQELKQQEIINEHNLQPRQPRQLKPRYFTVPEPAGLQKDWNNYKAMEEDEKRTGLGEHGIAARITDDSQKELEKKLYRENGFNALLSDMISVNRSVPDTRNEGCLNKKYLAKLPKTSVILPFFDEYMSVLLRSIYSIINRTPPELLEEIIIVDDGSGRDYLKQDLDDYVAEHFPGLVKVVRLKERKGLIGARMAGARKARGEVLVFFDSHVECNYNWLPPLIEPIAIHPKISTCPIIDVVSHENFEYSGKHQHGSRGAFNWEMKYKELSLLPENLEDLTKPSANPVMMGGLFAIGREFFFELGGYDEGLDIWGAEQYELSFKIWMCGGMLFNTPCSRVAHIFRGPMDPRPNIRNYNFVGRNHKRVAEVWMDEYKQYVYENDPQTYNGMDPGDLSEQHAIRNKLKCKSFKWFLEVVVPDLLVKYPPVPPPDFATGAIQNVEFSHYCLDTMNGGNQDQVGMFYCAQNKTHPQRNQFWSLSYTRDLRKWHDGLCLDVSDHNRNAKIVMWHCHEAGGNQFWYYNRENQWLVQGEQGNFCMEAAKEDDKIIVRMNTCDANNLAMKWHFGYVNHTNLDSFFVGMKD